MLTFLQSPTFRGLVLLLLITAVIVVAMITRPAWGSQDIATFVGGLAVVLFGAFQHTGASVQAATAAAAKPPVDPEP